MSHQQLTGAFTLDAANGRRSGAFALDVHTDRLVAEVMRRVGDQLATHVAAQLLDAAQVVADIVTDRIGGNAASGKLAALVASEGIPPLIYQDMAPPGPPPSEQYDRPDPEAEPDAEAEAEPEPEHEAVWWTQPGRSGLPTRTPGAALNVDPPASGVASVPYDYVIDGAGQLHRTHEGPTGGESR